MTGARLDEGAVVAYEYLWARESAEGREHGVKVRPCAIVVALVEGVGAPRYFIAPVTHSAPIEAGDGVELPPDLKSRFGLDDARSWIVVSEVNTTRTPEFELRKTPDGRTSYGRLSDALLKRVVGAIRANATKGKLTVVDRDAE